MTTRLLLISILTITLIGSLRADDPTPAEKLQIANDRKHSQNNMKMIGLAFHNYESANGHFPNNVASEKGKLMLSWRVLLLPYLEENELAKEFKMDEAWDSAHNKKLIEKMPKFLTPVRGKAGKGETFYRGFTGPSTMFEAGKEIKIVSITDGTSNTILCVEAEKSVPWTKPDDLPFDPKKDTLPKVGGSMFETGFNALMGDGSVRTLRGSVTYDTFWALVTPAGGEVSGDW